MHEKTLFNAVQTSTKQSLKYFNDIYSACTCQLVGGGCAAALRLGMTLHVAACSFYNIWTLNASECEYGSGFRK